MWVVVCAGCGKAMSINLLTQHWKFKHGWKMLADGSVDSRSNPFWKNGGVLE
jgi:hypothetical protein